MPSVCLISVTTGDLYERYARRMFASAADHFHPTSGVIAFRRLDGREGAWPAGTLYRYHAILEAARAGELDFDYVFMIDADMTFLSKVGPEIIGTDGITAVEHPGYVGMPRDLLPYERRHGCAASMPDSIGERYYAGGFVGGERAMFMVMAAAIGLAIEDDEHAGVTATWHDESHLNRWLAESPPETILSPSYCHPQDSSWYESCLWQERYEPKIVALDKTAEERQGRE